MFNNKVYGVIGRSLLSQLLGIRLIIVINVIIDTVLLMYGMELNNYEWI